MRTRVLTKFFSMRLAPDVAQLLETAAAAQGVPVSTVARRAIINGLKFEDLTREPVKSRT